MATRTPINTGAILQALLQRKGAQNANFDSSLQNTNRDYAANLSRLADLRRNRLSQGRVAMADHGLSQSGIALKNESDIQSAADQRQADYGQQKESSLSRIAQNRIMAEVQYNLDRANAERDATMQATPAAFAGGAPAPKTAGVTQIIKQAPAKTPAPTLMRPGIGQIIRS